MQTSKIARFPRHIREELNQRLDRSEPRKRILQWINSLPEVQAVLKADFEGEPLNRQNLQNWQKSGLVQWQLHQVALDFLRDLSADGLGPDTLVQLNAKLIRFLQMRYAAVASALPLPQEDPEGELKRLSGLCQNITALRRGDLSAERLAIEHERLAIEKSRSDAEKEKEFWAWTKRPDIQAKLYPNRDPDKIRREVDRMLSYKLLGINRPAEEPDETSDPAVLI